MLLPVSLMPLAVRYSKTAVIRLPERSSSAKLLSTTPRSTFLPDSLMKSSSRAMSSLSRTPSSASACLTAAVFAPVFLAAVLAVLVALFFVVEVFATSKPLF